MKPFKYILFTYFTVQHDIQLSMKIGYVILITYITLQYNMNSTCSTDT